MKRLIAGGFALFALLGGCASVTVTPLSTMKDAASAQGVRFYEPEPYLLVSIQPPAAGAAPDKAVSALQSQIVFLPNKTRGYIVQTNTGWGTANGSVTLQNGWMLSSLGAQVDSKGPETISAFGSLLTAAGGLGVLDVGGQKVLAPGIYHIEFGDDGLISKLTKVQTP